MRKCWQCKQLINPIERWGEQWCSNCHVNLNEPLPDYIVNHHPECGCERCIYGDDAAIWLFHPNEY